MKDKAQKRGRVFLALFRKNFWLVMAGGFLFGWALAGADFRDNGMATLLKRAQAACLTCICVEINHEITREFITLEHGEGLHLSDPEALAYVTPHICDPGIGTRGWIAYQFCRHREEFFVFYWFKEHLLAGLMMMNEQLVSGAMNQMLILGSFFDAKMQLETQRLFQELTARAHKDYHPSFGMCEIGTIARSLSASQRTGEMAAFTLSQQLQDRQMRNHTYSSSAGKGLDINHRWEFFRSNFCHPYDNDQQLGPSPRTIRPICQGQAVAAQGQRNKDVDYGAAVDYPNTINVDFVDGAVNPADSAVFTLASNLYGADVFSFFPESYFKDPNNEDEYMFVRSMVAKRSVAQTSFNAIIAMKAAGNPETAQNLKPYMDKVLEQLGIPVNPVFYTAIIGERPSYYAQMEFLTKKLYQRPEFYTDLYDKPVNIERKKAALRALGLIQNMDLFKSKLRTEAALSVLAEMETYKAQDALQDKVNKAGSKGLRSGQ